VVKGFVLGALVILILFAVGITVVWLCMNHAEKRWRRG
jgi:hypothetical protein